MSDEAIIELCRIVGIIVVVCCLGWAAYKDY